MSKDKQTEREERTIFIVLAIILLIAIGIIVTWYFTRNKEDKKLKDKKKPETKQVIKKEDDTTEEIAYVEPEAVQTVATTEETKVEIPAPVITYGSEINSLLEKYQNGIDLNTEVKVNLESFKNDVTAEDYQGNNVTVETLIIAYMIDGSQWDISNLDVIPNNANIDKIVILYTATDNDGRVTTKTIELDVNNNIANLQIINENKNSYILNQENGQYNLIIDKNEELKLSFYSNNIKETTIDDKPIIQSEHDSITYIDDVDVTEEENNSNAGTVTYSKSAGDLSETLKIAVNGQEATISVKTVDTSLKDDKLQVIPSEEESQDVQLNEDKTTLEYTTEKKSIKVNITLTDGTSKYTLFKNDIEVDPENIQLDDKENIFKIVVENQGIKKEYTLTIIYNNPSQSSMSAINLETNFENEIISLKSNKDMEEPKEEIEEEIDECETNTEEEKVEETELDQNTELEDTINSLENE